MHAQSIQVLGERVSTVWTTKGGRHGEREELLLSEEGLIGGGWEELGTLEHVSRKDDLAELYRSTYPDASDRKAANHVAQLWSLRARMQEGDLVVLPLKTTGTVAVGRITGPYAFRTDIREDTQHTRPVEWIVTDAPRDNFDQDLLYSFGAFLTFGRVKRDEAEARILRSIANSGRAEPDAPKPTPPGDLVDVAENSAEVDEAPDVVSLAGEQIRQFISRRFAGHELTRLVAGILEAQGFDVSMSPAGPDQGVDVLAGSGPLGLDEPRVVVQVKTGQADVETYRALRGTMQAFGAEQGLLVAWNGFRGTVRRVARPDHFSVRLWDADDLLEELGAAYDRLTTTCDPSFR